MCGVPLRRGSVWRCLRVCVSICPCLCLCLCECLVVFVRVCVDACVCVCGCLRMRGAQSVTRVCVCVLEQMYMCRHIAAQTLWMIRPGHFLLAAFGSHSAYVLLFIGVRSRVAGLPSDEHAAERVDTD